MEVVPEIYVISEILGREIFFRPPKFGARSPLLSAHLVRGGGVQVRGSRVIMISVCRPLASPPLLKTAQ